MYLNCAEGRVCVIKVLYKLLEMKENVFVCVYNV